MHHHMREACADQSMKSSGEIGMDACVHRRQGRDAGLGLAGKQTVPGIADRRTFEGRRRVCFELPTDRPVAVHAQEREAQREGARKEG